MRTLVICFFLTCGCPIFLGAQAPKVAGEAAEHLLSPMAKEAAEQATNALVKGVAVDTSKQVTEQVGKELNARLMEAASKYGEEVLVLARRVPEGSAALASRAPQLLPLTEKLGDDILRLEARAPGFGEIAAESYGKDDLPRLLRLSTRDMKTVVILATRATEPGAPKLLLEGAEKGGQRFLEKLSAKQILATGLSVAMITAAYRAPEVVVNRGTELADKLLAPTSYVAAVLFAIWGAVALWRWYVYSKAKHQRKSAELS